MICQNCRRDAPTRHVRFTGLMAALVVVVWSRSATPLCKSCVHSTFWSYTLTTAACGWWGLWTWFVTPFVLLINVVQYIRCCLTLRPVPQGAGPPELTPEAEHRLRPFADELRERLRRGEPAHTLAYCYARLADITPAQIRLFLWSKTRAPESSPLAVGYVVKLP
jgi:hypothetical protein